ncbi:MAG: radical SAM protein [Duncaniella sp.]|uniref:radical SAM/SPASM domain-containing protein n=1 Tax=Duncaniella sp. TaxID=2518496 RepID=UPI0023C6E1A5|nr:radical SAM protein [Duncaniella sp.]MDE6090338.1 radical SAM protein [Duncaniella sp.]
MKKTISPQTKFNIPTDIRYIRYSGKILTIFPNIAKWIVLDNEAQVGFLELLRDNNLQTSLDQFDGIISDAQCVVTQIIARGIENHDVKSCISDDTKQLHFYLTNGCNLRCPHCYMLSGEKSHDELTTTEVFNILRGFKNSGGASVTFSGGEVLTRNDFIEIIKYANSLDLRIRVLTNGVLWTDKLILEASKYINAVQISIDGYSEDSNSIVRGKNNFQKSLHTINSFISFGISTELAITPPYSSVKYDESEQFIHFCNDLISRYPSNLFKIKIAEQIIDGRNVHLSASEAKSYYEYICKIKSAINGWESELESFIRAFDKNEIMDNCMYGVFSIDSSGFMYFCSRISSLKPVCNVRETSFDEITKLSRIAQKLSVIDNFLPCKNCEIKYICGGGCRIDYFQGFTDITDVNNVNMNTIAPRNCTEEIKNRFYRLMIDSNHRLFR